MAAGGGEEGKGGAAWWYIMCVGVVGVALGTVSGGDCSTCSGMQPAQSNLQMWTFMCVCVFANWIIQRKCL